MIMKQPLLASLTLAAALLAAPCLADTVAREQFAWRAQLELPRDASLARVSLPADALLELQSGDARDVRVFNAAGNSVPLARLPAPAAPAAAAAATRTYPALAFNTAPAPGPRPRGAVQVRIDDGGRGRSVWVQLDGAGAGAGSTPHAALFATRTEKLPLKGLKVQATLPPNTPVPVTVSTSADLAQWSRVPVRGRLYRFEGEGAPANDTLEFDGPVVLEGRYLRLDWDAQAAVTIAAVAGVVAPPANAPPRLRAPLPTPQPADKGALEIHTGFLTPMAAIALSTANPNTLLPVRILGRNEVSEPWRTLAHTVIYRLGSGADAATNLAAQVRGQSVRWLRIESTSGADLGPERIQAEAEFAPIELVFVATGAPPFDLAFGRPATPPGAVPLATITSALGHRKLEDLPEARVGAAIRQAPAKGAMFGWPSEATGPGKRTVLWSVLVAGVLILAAVAWSLLRQLKADRPRS